MYYILTRLYLALDAGDLRSCAYMRTICYSSLITVFLRSEAGFVPELRLVFLIFLTLSFPTAISSPLRIDRDRRYLLYFHYTNTCPNYRGS